VVRTPRDAVVKGPVKETAGRRRMLFVAEAVTLCHVARPVVLARALDPALYEVHLACHPRYLHLFRALPFPVHRIHSITSKSFLEALALGRPLFDADTLRSYVREDLKMIRDLAPQVIVGDMRLSLSISARLAGVPYIAIANAHWSPYARPRFPVPELALTKRLGVRMGQLVFSLLRPFLFAHHALPLNRVRKEYGLPPLGLSLSRMFTDADETLYADLPELVPTFDRPAHHHYVGPILWSHETERPSWWDGLPADKPVVYVTLGSSGRSDLLPMVLEALADLPVVTVAATMGKMNLRRKPRNAWVGEYLPAEEAARLSDLVICNGGSATVYPALAAGVPVLGLPSNLDQYLTMSYVREAGAGDFVRSGQATVGAIKQAVCRILDSPDYKPRAGWLKGRIAETRAENRFVEVLARRFHHRQTPYRDVSLDVSA
jgi:UDP:flavonoid glycosyltransferase YjiC (YdhE family)